MHVYVVQRMYYGTGEGQVLKSISIQLGLGPCSELQRTVRLPRVHHLLDGLVEDLAVVRVELLEVSPDERPT